MNRSKGIKPICNLGTYIKAMQFKEFALNPEEYLDESTIQLLCSYGLNREDIVNSLCNGVKESKITIDTLKLIDRIYGKN